MKSMYAKLTLSNKCKDNLITMWRQWARTTVNDPRLPKGLKAIGEVDKNIPRIIRVSLLDGSLHYHRNWLGMK